MNNSNSGFCHKRIRQIFIDERKSEPNVLNLDGRFEVRGRIYKSSDIKDRWRSSDKTIKAFYIKVFKN